ncbi:DNA repair ATPase [Catalinimonas niigatensis]|uniref:DNA repair ATPase n=1 Tax=Catalinimonas niigatensis TaxID=1397264 RepID=UPI00266630A9|nr:DNA repair ATPase [Catalinimonas niigatensis]WPP51642.1 DNA repair ATPase [Catalinimonas niigatensis]
MQNPSVTPADISIENGAYEVLQNRLNQSKSHLREKLGQLNEARKQVFGSLETTLLTTERIHTANNCVPHDMVAFGDCFMFGYNVHLGLKTNVELSDVFSIYTYHNHSFQEQDYALINHPGFVDDFQKLYKYYKDTIFIRFVQSGPYLYMVFRISKGLDDIKAFKWQIQGKSLVYLDNRSELEIQQPEQHDFRWQRVSRDAHRKGKFPHISIEDKVFVETLQGDLTIKVEDNTDSGQGIYQEPVDDADQTLDDVEIFYALLENLVLLRIRPYQEKQFRYFVFNTKLQEVRRIDALEDACLLLPDGQGILFPNGYYLQTGTFKTFGNDLSDLRFEKKIQSPNGEDFLYVFYNRVQGIYQLLFYNLITQQTGTPIICHGYTIFDNGELCYFNGDPEPKRHHAIRIWQTPFVAPDFTITQKNDSYLYKVGNKDIVRLMAESQLLINLIDKGESYEDLYVDLKKQASTLLEAYYWLDKPDSFHVSEPISQIRDTAAAAIEEYEKVISIRKQTNEQLTKTTQATDQLLKKVRHARYEHIHDFVTYLTELRKVRGEIVSLSDLRYVDQPQVKEYENRLQETTERLAHDCIRFLSKENALQPYRQKMEAINQSIDKLQKVVDADKIEQEIQQSSADLEMLVEIVSNLKIEDVTLTTQIIDRISVLFSEFNKIKAYQKRKRKELLSVEGKAEFEAQKKLISQAMLNYLDVADTPARCDEYLNKLMVQLEELEGKFAEFDEFITQINDLREELYNAFEARKIQLTEARHKRANTLAQSAERILKAISNRVQNITSISELNGYFASDLMVDKVNSVIEELKALEDTTKAEDILSKLKSLKEDTIRQIRDRSEIYAEGGNTIRFGNHTFLVTTSSLALTTVTKEDKMYYHLTGTNFYEAVSDERMLAYRQYWEQSLLSENEQVYRAEYLAYLVFKAAQERNLAPIHELAALTEDALQARIQQFMMSRYEEGYIKGIHDHDATLILKSLLNIHQQAGLLRYASPARTCAALCWNHYLKPEQKTFINHQLKGAGAILKVFPQSSAFAELITLLRDEIRQFIQESRLFDISLAWEAAHYLFEELAGDDDFVFAQEAVAQKEAFLKQLERSKGKEAFHQSIESLKAHPFTQYELIRKWLLSWQQEAQQPEVYTEEAAYLLFAGEEQAYQTKTASLNAEIPSLQGSHSLIEQGVYPLHYIRFMQKLESFASEDVPAFTHFQALKKSITHQFEESLKLETFKPKVMSSFVRNRLIDKVYFPLIGANLAKQIGAAGDNKRTDRMGMLLLISPPGYGKTTLMEYIANRLGIIFMKINGPAIGHAVTSVDPETAPNAAAREELHKLNLAFEMGDNVMIYLDDIQHCHPEFLQKFISLCDAQRKIEGVYKGKSKTYDFRGKKICVVMAGNPYTESGDKFQIPDMLSNRADIYNLGDIIGDTAEDFKLSYIENCLTANPALHKLSGKSQKDVYALVKIAETGSREGISFEASHAAEEVNEYVAVLKKLLLIRDTVLRVNTEYIHSAAQAEAYRTEPSFKLQGSYRDMNKMAEKVQPVMNEAELQSLIMSHYESEAQTLTTGAEANLLKFKEMTKRISGAETQRWQEIKTIFLKNQQTLGYGSNGVGHAVAKMEDISQSLKAIAEYLNKNSEH